MLESVIRELYCRKSLMTSAVLVNLAIILLVMVAICVTLNPACILALFFLRDMSIDPSMLMAMSDHPPMPPEDETQPMGFTADIR